MPCYFALPLAHFRRREIFKCKRDLSVVDREDVMGLLVWFGLVLAHLPQS